MYYLYMYFFRKQTSKDSENYTLESSIVFKFEYNLMLQKNIRQFVCHKLVYRELVNREMM